MSKLSTERTVNSNENIIIKSQRYNTGKILGILVLIALLIAILVMAILSYDLCSNAIEQYNKEMNRFSCITSNTEIHTCQYSRHNSAIGFLLADMVEACFDFSYHLIGLAIFVGLTLIAVICYFGLKSYELVVTDKRVYGAISFGKRVDLPVDSISAVAVVPLSKGITVSTSSGSISFRYIKNAEEIHEVINQLLITRQKKQTEVKTFVPATNKVSVPQDKYDELKKLKELLDMGIITPEEFDAKKKQLLGL